MKIRCNGITRTVLGMLAALMLAGCESMYYDMVMDEKSAAAKGGGEKEDALGQANNISRMGSYR